MLLRIVRELKPGKDPIPDTGDFKNSLKDENGPDIHSPSPIKHILLTLNELNPH